MQNIVLLLHITTYMVYMNMHIYYIPCLVNFKSRKHLPLVNAEMWRCASMIPTESEICVSWYNYKHKNTLKILLGIVPQGVVAFVSDPWSASTTSPGERCENIPQCSLRCLSLTHPSHDSDTKATTLRETIPSKIFSVFLCL